MTEGTVTFKVEVADQTVAEVQSNLLAYTTAFAAALNVNVARVRATIVTSRRLVESTGGVSVLMSISTDSASVVEAAVLSPTFTSAVSSQLQSAGITAPLTVDTATISLAEATCSVTCDASTRKILVTHDTTSAHTHHQCYVADLVSLDCVCECSDSTQSDCTKRSNYAQ
jgi:hypothetical protein